jgi:hypothetical protein
MSSTLVIIRWIFYVGCAGGRHMLSKPLLPTIGDANVA